MKYFYFTGGICTGKSFILSNSLNKNINIIKADILTSYIIKKSFILLKLVQNYIMNKCIIINNTINKRQLSNNIFINKYHRINLEKILHPIIQHLFLYNINYVENKYKYVIYEAPIIIEIQLHNKHNNIILLTCNKYIQLNRLVYRKNYSKRKSRFYINSQLKTAKKNIYTHYIINNSFSTNITQKQLLNIFNLIQYI